MGMIIFENIFLAPCIEPLSKTKINQFYSWCRTITPVTWQHLIYGFSQILFTYKIFI